MKQDICYVVMEREVVICWHEFDLKVLCQSWQLCLRFVNFWRRVFGMVVRCCCTACACIIFLVCVVCMGCMQCEKVIEGMFWFGSFMVEVCLWYDFCLQHAYSKISLVMDMCLYFFLPHEVPVRVMYILMVLYAFVLVYLMYPENVVLDLRWGQVFLGINL